MRQKTIKIIGFSLLSVFILYLLFVFNYKKKDSKIHKFSISEANKGSVANEDLQIYSLPITFIGGSIRTGTTLMRTMLDTHPDVTCGPETIILPQVLQAVDTILSNDSGYMNETGLVETGKYGHWSILDQAMQQFIYTIVVKGKKPSKYYCNKDPLNLLYQRDMLMYLNEKYESMINQCEASDQCIMQKYEQLVLQPIKETKKIFKFLNIPWTEEVLNYDKHLDKTKFNSRELTTKDVQKPLYLDGLTKWVGKIPNDVLRDVEKLAPIMARMGYDVKDRVPYYGEPDDFVLKKVGDMLLPGNKAYILWNTAL